ncbi:YdgH/BhsA/McbA-like domain containing protein [Serratia sp. DD3]|uniref:multiple stress resistance protein BhsA n=1 Tax=Serratia sp. DD3 TaxID=1410619 RepID=UPI0003C4ED9E|nr:YdgH/BhsA/McbA-like domain containing protein [Serratia sp. DD3]KEY60776.1 multiple stress resistance protein BhsA [Serratia sp. DD3]
MNNIKYIALSAVLSMATFTSFAAESVNQQQSMNLTKAGVVSAGQASTLDTLEQQLAAKAAAQGATSYRIIAAGGNDLLYGSAEIYK